MRIRFLNLFIVAFLFSVVAFSCKTPAGQAARDLEAEYLSKYIARYHPTVVPKSSGLYFVETKAAAAADTFIIAGDIVQVFYKGYLIEDAPSNGIQDGYEFDKTNLEPFTFTVGAGSVIKGWDEALKYMKSGSEAKLVVPSILAYSSQSQTYIPAYSPLVFYISVYKVYHSGYEDKWKTIGKLPNGSN